LVLHLIEIAKCILHLKALGNEQERAVKESSRTSLSDLTEEVDCPWLDADVLLLFGRSKPADRLATRFTGEEEFGRFEAIVADGDRLK
jgi:hypothetical protein